MVKKLLPKTQMIWMIFIKILMNIIQIKKALILFDDMIADVLSNKKIIQ